MPDEFVKIYDLKQDHRKINLVQKATLETKDYGLVPEPALFGSPDWWRAVEENLIPVHTIEGIISRVYMSGHNDYPEFEIDDGQKKTQWTREGKDEAYVVGRRVKLKYVFQKPKRAFGGKYPHEEVLEIWINSNDGSESSPL
jgi:hypothetical protein